MASARPFADLHACARRHARRPDEADDLVQAALLAALESGRTDLAAPATRRWLTGVIRNRAAMDARTAGRRRRREASWVEDAQPHASPAPAGPEPAIATLPPALRLTALLALSGHTRPEIGWLLNLSDDALRQRISQLKRALAHAETGDGPSGALAFGRIRRALLGPVRKPDAFLASHDPDGHLFVVSRSHFPSPRQQAGG